MDWPRFRRFFDRHWQVGQHVAIVAQTSSGKTTLARAILPIRDYVVVFATKVRDDSLYEPLKRQGFVVREKWNPTDIDEPKVIFKPPLDAPTREAKLTQRHAFEEALIGLFATGGWTVFLDEVRYLTEELKLVTELNTLWLQGRSLDVTIVAGTQRPVSVPINMFEQARHLFAFRITGREDRVRAAEYMGPLAPVAFEVMDDLPRFETLYIDAIEDVAYRTKVDL